MASRKFNLFHLSLIQLRQMDLESFEGTREEWIRHSLKESFSFSYRAGMTMHWVKLEDDIFDDCIYGLLELKRSHERHEPPERGGAEIITEEWQGAYVIIDPTHHSDGQKVAVENDIVGKPSAILGGLIDAINARIDKCYTIEYEPIFDSRSFWKFAKDNDNILKSITFDFVVPNMWDASGGLDKDLKETGDDTGADRVKVKLSAKQGVSAKGKKVKAGVDYAERGAGTIDAVAEDGTPYSSKTKPKTTKVPKVDGDRTTLRDYFRTAKDRILGREKTSIERGADGSGGDTGSV